ncbi:hypothetical protein HLRTI_001333 [Halorhabdus tiamatea SARL4B]|uniref:Uncharacterized protein n=1 Tax=Halorhabdus tiamatea SARL4B TaxID=1033806 RepID=U2DLI3_9EURY|nr:hypothetical protein [Halorhabdus tiamatea]ERJ06627.1 hypothetical protein HLRTI_001333 [Halorhabdus tiamatea SARL4B]
MAESFEFTTKLWQRSPNSYASTIPREILAIKGAPTGDDARVKWSINPDTGKVEVEFAEETEGDD